MNLIRARAPLRLGLAGGGTDVSPFSDDFGGRVLNATIDRYAFASVEVTSGNEISFISTDLQASETVRAEASLPTDTGLRLHRGVYNRVIREFNGGQPISLRLYTHVESPMGSGLGSSSALVVAMLEAMRELVGAPLGEYDLARLAFSIEREDLALNGGRQDQYAAAFGGFNFMEFGPGDRVIVNPLRVRPAISRELETSLVLFFTGASRESAKIIDNQSASVKSGGSPLEAMHQLRDEAVQMKDALLTGDLPEMAIVLERGWQAKKRTSPAVSNQELERIYTAAIEAGALAGKVSGAGGGGFMMFLADPIRRADVVRRLAAEPHGRVELCRFTSEGAASWRVGERKPWLVPVRP